MDYSDVIYMHATASPLKPLDAVYHSALKFITGDVYSAHHCILYIYKKKKKKKIGVAFSVSETWWVFVCVDLQSRHWKTAISYRIFASWNLLTM